MRKASSIAVGILFILTLSGCDLLPLPKKSSGTKASVTTKSTGPILARINDWVLTIDEFDKQIGMFVRLNNGDANIPVEALGLLASTFIPSQIEKIDLSSPEGKMAYLDFLINQELLAQEAQQRGLDKSPEVIEGIRKSAVEILGFSLLKDILKDVKVTPIEVEDLYNHEYKNTLESIEQRKIREIAVDSKSKANDILVQLLTGSNFASLASQHSVAETASKGGDLGYLVRQPNVKFNKFWEIALTLDKGEVSSIFKNPEKNEYYLITVEDIKKGEMEPLDKVYNQLEFILTQQKTVNSISELMSKIKSKFEADLVINSNLIN